MHTVRYNGATITVHEQTGMDMMRARALLRRLLPAADDPDGDVWAQVYLTYVQVVTQAEIAGDLGFSLPPVTAPLDAHRAAALALMDKPGALIQELENALNAVNMPPGDPDLAPPEALADGQKKAPK